MCALELVVFVAVEVPKPTVPAWPVAVNMSAVLSALDGRGGGTVFFVKTRVR